MLGRHVAVCAHPMDLPQKLRGVLSATHKESKIYWSGKKIIVEFCLAELVADCTWAVKLW